MDRERLISILTSIKGKVEARTRRTIEKILALCQDYRTYGKNFTFQVNGDLDKEVNRLLVELTDIILGDIDKMAQAVSEEEDKDEVLAYIHRLNNGVSAQERLDSHNSHLKYALGAFIAIGFANNYTDTDILQMMMTGMNAPYQSKHFLKAIKDGGYASRVITKGGYNYGRGIQQDVIEAVTLVGQEMVSEAYQFGQILQFRRNPKIIGYTVHRGSGYDCSYCDELCVGIHPLTEICLPAHPRCMCYMIPVYA